MTTPVSYRIETIDGHEYWSPFSQFLRNEEELLNSWRIHYHHLGIRTQTVRGQLYVHLKDDRASWPRVLPFEQVAYEGRKRVHAT